MYRPNTERLWKEAKDCTCGSGDCSIRNHKLCPICNQKMLYGSHFTNEKTKESQFAWNIDLIVPKSEGGSWKLNNMRAVHIKCNKSRNNMDQSREYEK